MYHPDLNNASKEAETRFIAVSNAWAILGDDRRRRAYDRSLDEANTLPSTPPSPSASAWNLGKDDLRRRSRATYTSDPRRHPSAFSHAPDHGRPSFGAKRDYGASGRGSYTYSYDYTRGNGGSGRTGTARRKANEAMDKFDQKNFKLQADNSVWRFAQVFGVFWIVMSMAGGWSLNAS